MSGASEERLIRLQHHSTKLCIIKRLEKHFPHDEKLTVSEVIEQIHEMSFERCRAE